jgi:ABC-type Na+ efflux pump permease subunit
MLQELLKNPAFAELYKNAPQLNNIEVPKIDSGGFVPTMPVIAPFVQTPAITPTAPNLMPVNVIGNMPPKDSKGDWVLSAIKIGVGILLCFAAYKIYKNHTEKNKSI